MSNEVTVRTSLIVRKKNSAGTITLVDEQCKSSFSASMAGTKGPTPGSITVTPTGTDVVFTELTGYGGWVFFQNNDPTNYVTWGVWDTATLTFYFVGELLPTEGYPFRLSRFFGKDIPGTGTGGGTGTITLRFKSYNQNCNVTVKAFDP